MPLFFLLSGFCLALGSDKNVPYRTFLMKRIIRIYPIYLSTFLLLLPHNDAFNHPKKCITSLLMIHSWLDWDNFSGQKSFYRGNEDPFNSVRGFHQSWTVSTLFFFYLFYPKLVAFCHQRSCRTLTIFIAISYLLQLIFGCCLLQKGFRWATMWPLSRFPVFVMGVCAGVICKRMKLGNEDALSGT